MKLRAALLLLATLSPLSALAEGSDPLQLLNQMQSAAKSAHFELSMVQTRQGRLEPQRYTHGVVAGMEIAHLGYLDGQPLEFLQRNRAVTFFEGSHDPYTLDGARLPGLWSTLNNIDWKSIANDYNYVEAGRSRVAGLVTQVIRVIPKSDGKYGLVLMIDETSKILLRADVIDAKGNLIEQLLSVKLDAFSAAPSWLVERAQQKLPKAMEPPPKPVKRQTTLRWTIGWLPQGFKIINEDRHRLVSTEEAVEYQMASDGLFSFSVYLSQNPNSRQHLVRQGTTTLFTLPRERGFEVSVVGEIPPETAKRIAESLHVIANQESAPAPTKTP